MFYRLFFFVACNGLCFCRLLCVVWFLGEFGGCIRFLSRAGTQLAEQRGNWWTATEAMSQSQVYTRTFGLAVTGFCWSFWHSCLCFL